MARRRGRLLANLIALAFICLVLPLLGIIESGSPVGAYLRFPPHSRPMNYPSFHPAAFGVFIAFVLLAGVGCFWSVRAERMPDAAPATARRQRFPWWGWASLAAGACAWVLAWTRFDWCTSVQPYTFMPQWIFWIATINAMIYARKGRCPMLSEPRFFLQLFAASAVLWWLFEYLNQFVNNWIYAGADCERHPVAYGLFASFAFATVLPGVYSTKELLNSFSSLQRISVKGLPSRSPEASAFYILALILTAGGFFLSVGTPNCYIPSCGSAPSSCGFRWSA